MLYREELKRINAFSIATASDVASRGKFCGELLRAQFHWRRQVVVTNC